jgi:phosphohistidine phosphatase
MAQGAVMKALLVMRHAKSSWKNPSLDDHDRPLKKRGRRAAPRMGGLLLSENLVPDGVLCSTAVRAVETAQLVIGACGYRGRVNALRELYLAVPEVYIDALREHSGSAERVLLVGHNPGLEQLVEGLSGRAVELPTAALVSLRLPIDNWGATRLDGRGELVQSWTPKRLETA